MSDAADEAHSGSMRPIIRDVFSRMDERFRVAEPDPEAIVVDDLLPLVSALRAGELVVIAGGGTLTRALASRIIRRVTRTPGRAAALYLTLGRSRSAIGETFLAEEAEVGRWQLYSGELSRRDMDHLSLAAATLTRSATVIDDRPHPTVATVTARCRRWRASIATTTPGLVVIHSVDELSPLRGGATDRSDRCGA